LALILENRPRISTREILGKTNRSEAMEPYARPNEKKVGSNRPKISHLPSDVDTRTRQQRQAEKQAVTAERRAIKKAARRNLKREMEDEISKLQR